MNESGPLPKEMQKEAEEFRVPITGGPIPIQENEIQLDSEQAKILENLVDIGTPGQAYTTIRIDNKSTVHNIFKNGLIGIPEVKHEKWTGRQRRKYLQSLHENRQGTYESSTIWFNITGRTADFDQSSPKHKEIANSGYTEQWKDSFILLFSQKAFHEVAPAISQDEEALLFNKHFQYQANLQKANFARPGYINEQGQAIPNSIQGFTLNGRVAPRFFKGIMLNERSSNPSQQEQETQDKKLDYLVSQMEKCKRKLPVYDIEGNLIWPQQMSYEEVKQYVAEGDAKKQEREEP